MESKFFVLKEPKMAKKMAKNGMFTGLIMVCLGFVGCTTLTKTARGYNEPYTENVVTQYSGVLSDGRTVIVSAEEHDRIVAHIREVDSRNNKLYYSPDKGTYKMPPVETEIWRTYKGTVWTPKTQAVTKQRFVQTEDAKGKFSIGKTLLMTALVGIGVSYGPLIMDGEVVHPAIGFGSGVLASGLLNLMYQPVEFWDVESVTFW
jgi:hypothetical protein